MRPLRAVPTSFAVSVLIVALLGFADATYLTVEHFRDVIPPCTTDGCQTVLTSAYSTILGMPVSLAGAIFYLVILIGTFAYLEGGRESMDEKGMSRREPILRWALLITPLGFLASVYFFILQAFVIHSFCQYCLGSAGTSTILFILGMVGLKKYRKGEVVEESVQ